MSTKVASLMAIPNLTINTSTTDLSTKNDQLLSIINNQQVKILSLEKELAQVKKKYDTLLEEKKQLQQVEPIPPPRSPYRPFNKLKEDTDSEEDEEEEEEEVEEIDNHPIPTTIDSILMKNHSQHHTNYMISPTSPTSPKISSPIHAILDKDAKLFAKYQQAIKNKSTSLQPIKKEKEVEEEKKSTNNDNDEWLINNNVRRALSQPNLSISPYEVPSFSNIMIKVADTYISKNNKGKDIVSFIVSICHASSKNELWRIEKVYSDFLALDILLRGQNQSITKKLGKLPDKTLLAVHDQSKINQRMIIIEKYLTRAIQLPLPDTSDLSQFLSSNVIEQSTNQSTFIKEGYLSKCTKSFGGWKPFYFILNGSTLDYYESKGGLLLGSIQLSDAQVGLQQNKNDNILKSSKTFTITQKSSSSPSKTIQHTLCANSDEDCYQWIQTISKLIKPTIKPSPTITTTNISAIKNNNTHSIQLPPRRISKDQIKPIPSSSRPISPEINNNNNNQDNSNRFITCEQISFHTPYYYPQRSNSDTSILPNDIKETRGNGNYHSTSMDETYTTTSPLHTFTQLEYLRQRSSMDTIYLHQRRESHDPSSHHHHHSTNNTLTTATTTSTTTAPPNGPSSHLLPTTTSFEDETSSKKLKSRTNRRTFWPKKIFSGYHPTSSTAAPYESSSSTTSVLRGFLSRNSNDENASSSSSKHNSSYIHPRHKITTPVFGVPLEEAVRISKIAEGYELPAVVYRCIEFLEAKEAYFEEGIYRLSGSAVKIKELKRAFDEKGDINLLTSDEYKDCDMHAISGLLKLWLRELPSNVLTSELLKEFLPVIDLTNRNECINELGRLISMLPLANYTLLRALTAHLLRIVQNSDVNKMTLRNIGIVFSPTLGIPTGIFSLFLCEFDYIFYTLNQSTTSTTSSSSSSSSSSPLPSSTQPVPSTNNDRDDMATVTYNTSSISTTTTLVSSTLVSPPPPLPSKLIHDDKENQNSAESNDSFTTELDSVHPYQQQPIPRTNLNHSSSDMRSNRNSVQYSNLAPECIVDIEKQCKEKKGIIEDDHGLEDDDDFDLQDTHFEDEDGGYDDDAGGSEEDGDDDPMNSFDDGSAHEIQNKTEILVEN
ncbi:hypothetical protein BJ944DRAFT_183857 [Cunninghamella echinulata]|nr:hypothetical protein BJ944DRAFT_183857 [Cunninghamella echinulata]